MAELAHKRHTKTASVKLGAGAYVRPDVEDVGEARTMFFRAVEQHAQPALVALRDRVIREYRRRSPNTHEVWLDHLLTFAQDFHLTTGNRIVPEWVRRQLAETLRMWVAIPSLATGDRLSLGGYVGYWSMNRPGRETMTIELPTVESLRKGGESVQEVKRRLVAEIDAELDLVCRQAEAEGLVPTREKQRDHFAWAARFQVGGEDVPSLASSIRDGSIDDRSVNLAIRAVLETIGLDRRRERPGPKSRKARSTRHTS